MYMIYSCVRSFYSYELETQTSEDVQQGATNGDGARGS